MLHEPKLCLAFPIRQYTSWYCPQEGFCRTVWSILQFHYICHWRLWNDITKKSICDQLTFFLICCMPNHPSPLLLSRTTLLWRTSHTGTQRNPSGKLVTAVFPSRRAFWMRYGQRTTSNHISTFQASLDGTLDLRVFYMNNAFQYEIKS